MCTFDNNPENICFCLVVYVFRVISQFVSLFFFFLSVQSSSFFEKQKEMQFFIFGIGMHYRLILCGRLADKTVTCFAAFHSSTFFVDGDVRLSVFFAFF